MVNQEWRKDVRIFKYLHIFSFFKIFKGLSFLGISNGQYKRYPRSLQLSSKINVDAGECPAANPLTDAECAGAVSNCWSPGQNDTDCPNFGLCCFDGCANTCVDDNTLFIPVCYELCEYDSVEKCCDFPAKDCNLVTHEICTEEDTWECNDIEVETCSFFVDTITELATDQHCNVKCVDQPCKEIPMYWCKTCKNDQPNHVCRP